MAVELTPDTREILRYLGHRGQELDPQTRDLLTRSAEEMKQAVKPRYTYRIFDIVPDKDRIFLPESNFLLPGKDICKHLEGSRKCALLAVTLGIEADNLIRIAEAESMSRAVVLDACATELAEKLCDKAEAEIGALAAKENLSITSRFSPGYGDLPITIQNRISVMLDTARKIGLTITENALMLPRKSVTAIIGFTEPGKGNNHIHGCADCSMNGRCQFQKEGSTCGR